MNITQFLKKNMAIQVLAVLTVQLFFCEAKPHIIGGSVNLALSEDDGHNSRFGALKPPRWLNSIMSSSALRSVDEHNNVISSSISSVVDSSSDDVFSRIRSPGEPLGPIFLHSEDPSTSSSSLVHTLSDLNPFLRAKRDVDASCPLPEDMPQQVRDLNDFLEADQFIGLEPEQPEVEAIPTDQPPADQCPASSGSWWPRRELNLRSTCPWIYVQKDNGADVYPRYVREAKCLCHECLKSTSMSCQRLEVNATVFRRVGCKDGVALMNKEQILVKVGCYCASPINGSGPVIDTSDVPWS
ncbi:uncharacterized protein LOC101857312 [Aplysia californica]|uniref:Uncharacterized protein LOC101857312 n=1 Tax=Aplysia californica TaxID=6500 RepID=A0ABM0JE37_APLCA|nr:uncharacterized protein LOC101857312 [Aplysia californica]